MNNKWGWNATFSYPLQVRVCWGRAARPAGHRGWILKHGHLYTTVPQSHVSCRSTHTARAINNKLRGHNKSLFSPASATSLLLSRAVFSLLSLLVNLRPMILPLLSARRNGSIFWSLKQHPVGFSPYLLVLSRTAGADDGITTRKRKRTTTTTTTMGAITDWRFANLHFILCYLHYSAPLESAIKGN